MSTHSTSKTSLNDEHEIQLQNRSTVTHVQTVDPRSLTADHGYDAKASVMTFVRIAPTANPAPHLPLSLDHTPNTHINRHPYSQCSKAETVISRTKRTLYACRPSAKIVAGVPGNNSQSHCLQAPAKLPFSMKSNYGCRNFSDK